MISPANLYNTLNCPIADRCRHCGRQEMLDHVAVPTRVGFGCETLCAGCRAAVPPSPGHGLNVLTPSMNGAGLAGDLFAVEVHAKHVGTTVEEAARAYQTYLDARRNRGEHFAAPGAQ